MSDEENSEEVVKLLKDEHQTFISTCFLYCLTFFFFILPIKFGNSFLPAPIPSFPDSIIFGGWPGYFLTILAGLFLIVSIIIYRPNRISKGQFYIISAWLLLTVVTAAFGYYPYEALYYYYSINQTLVALLVALLVAICLQNEDRARKFIIAGISGGLFYSVLNGVYQYGWGFADNIQFFKEMRDQGVQFPQAHVSRIMQKLVFSHFTISNSFAAHIILTLPLAAYIILTKMNKKHPVVCRVFGTTLILFSLATFMSSDHPVLPIICLIIGMLLCFGLDHVPEEFLKLAGFLIILTMLVILILTRSRAGMICFGAGMTIAGIICFKGWKRKASIGILILGILAGFFIAPRVASFQVRLGYYEALTNMFMEKPMGYGFGGFSEFYNRTKGPGIEESNSPHSFFFGYLGHGGIFAGLAVIACYFLTLFAILKKEFDYKLKFCLIGGFTSWFLHSQLDFNIMIPGTVATAAIIMMLSVGHQKREEKKKSYALFFTALIPVAITCIYFASEHSYYQYKYAAFHEILSDIEQAPPIDKVQDSVKKVSEKLPSSTAAYDEAAAWAIEQYDKSRGRDQIQRFAYLSLAEESLNNAIEINPKKASFFTRLARVYFEMKNYAKTREMLDKAFELYPYNNAAVELELIILREWIRREPQAEVHKVNYIKNRIISLEITLGRMNFSDHLMISRNQLKSMYDDLDKRIRELYTEIGLIRKSGLKTDLTPFVQQVESIHSEAKKVAGVSK